MNPFKAAFSLMGLIYLILFMWAVIAHLGGSVAITTAGFLVCLIGWFMSDAYLS